MRMVAFQMGLDADPTKEFEPYEPAKSLGLQYCNPFSHRRLLSCIMRAHIPTIKETIQKALALSIRVETVSIEPRLIMSS